MARSAPVASFILAALLFALGALVAGLLLWMAYNDVPARMWILVGAVGLVSLLAGAAVRAGTLMPGATILLAALVPIVGLILLLGIGWLVAASGYQDQVPARPTDLAWALAPWVPLWAVLAAFGAWLARRRSIAIDDRDVVVVHR